MENLSLLAHCVRLLLTVSDCQDTAHCQVLITVRLWPHFS